MNWQTCQITRRRTDIYRNGVLYENNLSRRACLRWQPGRKEVSEA